MWKSTLSNRSDKKHGVCTKRDGETEKIPKERYRFNIDKQFQFPFREKEPLRKGLVRELTLVRERESCIYRSIWSISVVLFKWII